MRIFKKEGSPSWWVTYNRQGQRIRQSLRTEDRELANQRASLIIKDAYEQDQLGKIPEWSFAEAATDYAKHLRRKNEKQFLSSYRYRIRMLVNEFGKMNLSDIDSQAIEEFWEDRLEISQATAQREVTMLKAILRRAHNDEKLTRLPRFPEMERLPSRERYLSLDEEKRLLRVCTKHLLPIVIVALDTGGRRNELLNLEWQDVNFESGMIGFKNTSDKRTKNKRDRFLGMTQRVRKALVDLGPKNEGRIFLFRDEPIKDVKGSFHTALAKAEIENFRFHDLRHTFASRLVQKGRTLYEVQRLLGHASYDMVQRYAHLAPEFGREAASALESYWPELGTAEESDDLALPAIHWNEWRTRHDSNVRPLPSEGHGTGSRKPTKPARSAKTPVFKPPDFATFRP